MTVSSIAFRSRDARGKKRCELRPAIPFLILLVTIGCGGGSNAISPPPPEPPPAPEKVDWRFQGMDLPAGTVGGSADLLSFQSFNVPNFIGTPLQVFLQFGECGTPGPSDCAWRFFGFTPPAGIMGPTSLYKSDSFENLDSDLNELASENTVITSLDLEPANQIFAVGGLQSSGSGAFEYFSQTVAPDELQATVAELGKQSQMVTALSYDGSGNVFVVSYGWTGDTTTVYETEAVIIPSVSTNAPTANSDAIATAINSLAGQGHVITAMGGNAANGLVMVGTRVAVRQLIKPVAPLRSTPD